MSTSLVPVSGEGINKSKREAEITEMKLKNALKWVAFLIKIETRSAIFCLVGRFGRHNSKAVRNVAASRAVEYETVAYICRTLPDTIGPVVKMGSGIVFVGFEHADTFVLRQPSDHGSETGTAKDQ